MSQGIGHTNQLQPELAASSTAATQDAAITGNNTSMPAARHPSLAHNRAPQNKRIPSPLQNIQHAQSADLDVKRSATHSPYSPGFLASSPGAGRSFSVSGGVPPSPNRVKGRGSPAFEAVKAAASRDALLEEAAAATRPNPADVPQSLSMSVTEATSTAHARPNPLPLRTASLDSNISLTSSPSTKLGPPQLPSEAPDAVDIPALIQTAGSPEAAIRRLLQEKHSASSHNAQLWRLVEKQRVLILGLNKDLEKVSKDRERYRKKLKDHLISSASVATLSGTTGRPGATRDADELRSPSISEIGEESGNSMRESPGSDVALDRSHNQTPQSAPQLVPSPLAISSPMHTTPMQAPFGAPIFIKTVDNPQTTKQPSKEPGSPRSPRSSRSPTGTPPGLPRSSPVIPSISTQQWPSPSLPQQSSPQRSSTSSAQVPAPLQSFSGNKERAVLPLRKGPPAPLNLSQQEPNQAPDSSASEYTEDGSGGSSALERGRRKTRDDDDRDRERQASQTEESISRSRQRKQAAAEEAVRTPERGMSVSSGYSSPEEAGSPHVAQAQTFQSISSLNAVLRTPQDAEYSADIKQSLAPMVKSPGLPLSPRPIDRPLNSPAPRAPKAPMSSIPMTPRTGGLPLSPRQPRQPIPMPPQTPLSISSPHLLRAEQYAQEANNDSMARRLAPPSEEVEQVAFSGPGTVRSPGDIYRGFMVDQYPGLLLPPNALPMILVKVDSSRLRPSRHSYMAPKQSEENPVFTLAVYARSNGSQLWRVEKTLLALSALDQQVKQTSTFRTKLPDRNLFTGHAPARIDARRSALGYYFDAMLEYPLEEHAATIVCAFFSSDTIGTEATDYFQSSHVPSASIDKSATPQPLRRRDGYLTKKGKNFGGWKARYFVCDGPMFKYFEAPGGAQLGAIKLRSARIGRQTQQTQEAEEDVENQYRHAFLVLEPKKKDSNSYVRHVLCAESDEERDAWVDCLLQYVDMKEDGERDKGLRPPETYTNPRSPRMHKSMNDISRPMAQPNQGPPGKIVNLRAVNYSDTIAAEAPVMVSTLNQLNDPPSPGTSDAEDDRAMAFHPAISGPTNGTRIQNTEAWGNRQPPNVLKKEMEKDKERKRSIFAFRGRSSSEAGPGQAKDGVNTADQPRAVFGAPLVEACDFAAPTDVPVYLPAVVYRSIEYLRAKGAVSEEGIFRMSGSNVVIKALRERFNTEGDVKLLSPDEQYYDIHAVASLLKLYLRELPVSILTRELHIEFLKCLELEGGSKIEGFNVLINRLPRANRELLEQLCTFLREIVDNEAVNKMSVRNVGIVFAPTLTIPAPLITFFVTDLSFIFGPPLDISNISSPFVKEAAFPRPPSLTHSISYNGESIRSPRKQMFSDLPTTPAYSQLNFSGMTAPGMTYEQQQRMAKEAFDTGFTPLAQQPRGQQTSRTEPILPTVDSSSTPGSTAKGILNVSISQSPLLGSETSPDLRRNTKGATSADWDEPARRLRRQSGQFLMNVGLLDQEKANGHGRRGHGDAMARTMPGTPVKEVGGAGRI